MSDLGFDRCQCDHIRVFHRGGGGPCCTLGGDGEPTCDCDAFKLEVVESEPPPPTPTKRITLTIEWQGACSEDDWAYELSKLIISHDQSRGTKIIHWEALTRHGLTEAIPDIPKHKATCDVCNPPGIEGPDWYRWLMGKLS